MDTVENILRNVYGDPKTAARELGVTPPAISNYKARGHFPSRLVVQIFEHAKERGLELGVENIPTFHNTGSEKRRAA